MNQMCDRNPGFLLLLLLLALAGCRDKSPALYERMPASKTGVTFANTIVEDDNLNIVNLLYLYNGAGVGVGDVNGDGLPDIFFAGNAVQSKLYLNRGDWRFEDISEQAGITDKAWCTGVSMVDIDQDGWLDIYVSTVSLDPERGSPNLLYLNQGPDASGVPVFVEQAQAFGLADTGYSTHAAFFDYDGDGDLDVYVLTNSMSREDRNVPRLDGPISDGSAPSTDRLYRNNGDKTFTDVSREAGIRFEGWGLGLVIADVNGDNWPDVYVANDFLTHDLLYINNGDGTFTNRISEYFKHLSQNAMGVDIADFNNDGLPDVVVLDMLPEDNQRQKSMFAAPDYARFQMNRRQGYEVQYVRNTLQLNQGNGVFSEIGQLAGIHKTDWSWTALFMDMDNDGLRDLLISNGYQRDVTDLDYVVYSTQSTLFGTPAARTKKLLDAANQLPGVKKHNYLYRNRGDLTFEDMSQAWGFGLPSYSNGVAYADLDGDGDLDLVINNLNDPAFLYRNMAIESRPQSAHFLRIQLEGPPGNRAGISAKIRIQYPDSLGNMQQQYAEQNLYRGYKSTVESIVHFGLGRIERVKKLEITWPDGTFQQLDDLPANQVLTLRHSDAAPKPAVAPAQSTPIFARPGAAEWFPYTHEETDHVDFNYHPLLPHKHSQAGPGMAVADVNGDGLDDVFIGGSAGFAGTLMLQQPSGAFVKANFPADHATSEDLGALFFDADGDGDADLYVVSGSVEAGGQSLFYQDRLYLNDGKGAFTHAPQALPEMAFSGSCVVAADYDGDGDLDLFVGGRILADQYPLPASSVILRNEGGTFTDATAAVCPELKEIGLVTTALWTDYNNDGRPDLLLAGEWMPLTLFQNENGVLKPVVVDAFAHSYGWWNSLIAGDFDRDGDTDYLAGNLGLNSRYKASVQEPVCIYANDYDGDGKLDPILCHYIQGKNYPAHPRDALVKQMAGIKRRFPLYAEYGRRTFEEMFTPEEMQGVHIVRSETFESTYIENLGGGKFAMRALPVQAQFAPVFGMLAGDYTGDGLPDVLLVGNSYATEIDAGHYDASIGLLLAGDGKGGFLPVSVQESGFFVDGDAKSLVSLATGGPEMLILAAENAGPVRAFSLSRKGPAPLAVGTLDAWAEITHADGAVERRELAYGAGYLSHSARRLWLPEGVVSVRMIDFSGKSRPVFPLVP